MKKNLNKLSTLLLMILMAVIPSTVWADDPNDEIVTLDGVSYHVLRSTEDWERFRQLVADANGSDVNAIMDADFTVTDWVGLNEGAPFRGTFNGNGHTLNVNIDNPYNDFYMAPFVWVTNATIRNLHVTGSVSGGKHSAGLVGTVGDSESDRHLTVERVWVSVTVTGRDNPDFTGEFVGGFVGHARKNTVKMTDCLFDGKLLTENKSEDDRYAGAFIGWGEDGATYDFCRLYDNGSWKDGNVTHYNISYWQFKPWTGSKQPCVYSAHDWKDVPDSRSNIKDQYSLANYMNNNEPNTWQVVDGIAVPIISVDPTFECYDIAPGSGAGEEGMLKIPFSCDQVVKWIDYWYTDENGNRKDMPRLTLPDNSYSGFLTVPATEAHRDLKMIVSLTPDYVIYTYDPKSDAVMHNPRNLTCDVLNYSKESLTNAGAVVLHWETKDAEYNDVLDGDEFVVLRSLTGKDEDMTVIGSVTLDSSISKYEYKDSTLFNTITAEQISSGTAQATYWVVRASAKQMWSMTAEKNPTVVTIKPQLDKLALLEPTGVKAEWSDKDEHRVKVTWDYKANDDSHRYVWDNRVGMMMEVKSLRSDNTTADSTVTVITAEQIQAGEMEVAASRACVTYQITLLFDGSKSPLGKDTVSYAATLPEDKFYHENTGHIDKESLEAQEQPSSVLLTWSNVDDNAVDYYEVWRRDAGSTEDFKCIAEQLNYMQFEDKDVSPVKQYEYYVKAANNCEGTKYEQTKTITANCSQKCSLEGFLRFSDGTGIPGIEINVTAPDGSNVAKVTTDDSGFFRVTDLTYINGTETTYTVAPNLTNFTDQKPVTFTTTPGGNMVKGVTFVAKQSSKISGKVLYSGTNIPVQGVSFLVDGHEMHNASGKVVTNFEGAFDFNVLPDEHIIQAVKEGHTLAYNGYYHQKDDDPEGIAYDFTEPAPGLIFYDDTKVKLIGRVAGGKEQGEIPLGNSLSRNNLGDELQIVLTLEGDNASRLVYDVKDKNKKERDEVYSHNETAHDTKYDYHTNVHTTLNRMVITPDVHTGEYMVMLPPVKWKVQQITAKGYPTLFQNGQINDVIDLSDSLTLHKDHFVGSWKNANDVEVKEVDVEYNAQYSRIYHSPVVIDYKQVGYEKFDFFGDQYYNFKNITGDNKKLTLAYGVRKPNWPVGKRDSMETHYTFGYPVFSIERRYPVKISATERYYYNNNIQSDTLDIIRLSGGEVTIHNGLLNSMHSEVIQLDSVGEAIYNLETAQLPYLLKGDDALRTVTMTLEMDGTHYEAIPLRAYILNIRDIKGAKDIINHSVPQLVDILRDPPGGTSHATISKGSTLKYAYQMDMNWEAGMSMTFGEGTGFDNFQGIVGAPMGSGVVAGFNNTADSKFEMSFDLVFSGSGQRAFAYTMTAAEDISTSSDKTMVGAEADLYIGLEQNIILKRATAIRAIPDSVFKQAKGLLAAGRMVEIAQGMNENGDTLHLVRDEVITYGPEVTSNFVHSQSYIITQLIPSLKDQCLSLIFTGTESEAQQRADATGKPVYLTNVPADDENFGFDYKIVVPSGNNEQFVDEVKYYKEIMTRWMLMIAQNEKEKLEARDLVQNFSTDGGGSISYSETFSSDYSEMNSYVSPVTPMTSQYFDNFLKDGATSIVALVGPTVAKFLAKILSGNDGNQEISSTRDKDNNITKIEFKMLGVHTFISLVPALNFSVTPNHTEEKAYSRQESFTIGMDKNSHLDFDVYRVKTASTGLEGYDIHDVFLSNNFFQQVDYDEDFLKREMDLDDVTYAHSFVYRTRGGATCRPYEGERISHFYNPGTVIDEKTKKIENPIITMDKQSISGVPFGEAARFKLYLANESEQPEAAYYYFTLYQNETSNPDGAKLMIDGMPLTGNGRTVEIHPGQVTEKTLEVYASEKFDYKDLKIGLISMDDIDTYQEVLFDVHYLQTAGGVSITTPGDKWILNCDAPMEGEKWYMPVIISGFDKNQHNFDHIEFQYKESTRGDDYWTNLCGFYADSLLYKTASGTKEMIPENGNISTRFFGEGVVIEKAYDLRAVLFCRNGNSFLTHESKVLSGVKDTRRPQLFGYPEPTDGILEVGDNIVFNFSEDIEYNYLREEANFEVVGETNNTSIQDTPALQFGGDGYAQSEVRRNFADKDFTIEVMVKPEANGKDMPVFSHGRDGKNLQLWVTADRHLRAVVGDKILEGTTELKTATYSFAALSLDYDQKKLTLFTDGEEVSLDNVTYNGYGPLIFGSTNQTDVSQRSFYSGRMLQGRVWNRAMDVNTLNFYDNRLLTGYEQGLTDYYPMNEGRGEMATDLAQGAHLTLNGVNWAQPDGMSLKLDKNEQKEIKGLKLKSEFFARTAEQDYTLMFWFKTNDDGHGALLCNGSGRKTDVGARDKFFIGFEGPTLKYRTNGNEFILGENYSDNSWHHYAMTVNRSRQIANIYVDQNLRAQFPTDSLGAMTGDFYLGNMVWKEEGSENDKIHQDYPLTGNIDCITLFEKALPMTLINRYANKALGGKEKDLLTYVDFERQEMQQSGELVLVPFSLNKVVKPGVDGTENHDSIFVDAIDYITQRIAKEEGAPVQAYEELGNVKFSFVGHDNSVLVNIDEPDTRINKRTVYATLRDIPDLNGNLMASPVTISMFVDLNPLRWARKTHTALIRNDEYHDSNFNIGIMNTSGVAHTYTVENIPRWLSVDTATDVIEPKSEQTLTFTINKDANIGTYDDIIYLTDENGLSEPLALNITIEGKNPGWVVTNDMKKHSMSIVARVDIEGDIVTDPRDKVAVFDNKGRCMGVANINSNNSLEENLVYLSVYDSTAVASPLNFRLWHYETGKVMILTPSQKDVVFVPEGFLGSTKDPLLLHASDMYVQNITLKPGWNWVSLNVLNDNYRDVKKLIENYNWENGDMFTDENNHIALYYQDGQWLSNNGTAQYGKMTLKVCDSYRVKVGHQKKIEIVGAILKTEGDRTITVKQGWNSIGYTPIINLPVSTALADYFDNAMDGDVVKSKTEFAMFSSDAKGSGDWKGSLEYMKPGEGYMLYRKLPGEAKFIYPFYEANETFFEETSDGTANAYSGNMTLTAVADGIDLEEGDRVIAYANAEIVGECIMKGDRIYMNIAGEANAPISFVVERGGDIIAATDKVMNYATDAISGSYKEPTKIGFTTSGKDMFSQEGWYTLQGVKLEKRPAKSGVYIYNGRKKVIK